MKLQDPLPTHDGRPGYRGSIVNIASNLGVVCLPRKSKCRSSRQTGKPIAINEIQAPYDTSKAAVIHMTKSDALDVSLVSFTYHTVMF